MNLQKCMVSQKKTLKCEFLTWIYLSYRPVTFCNFCILWFNPVYLDVPVIIPGSKERFLISILRHFLESWVPRWASWVRSPPGVRSPAGFRTVPVLVTPTGRVVIAWLLFWGSSPLLLCSSWHIFLTVGGKVLDFQRHFVLSSSLLYFWHLSETISLIFNVLFRCQARNVGQVLFTRQWLYQGRRAGHTLITRGILFYLQQVCFFTTGGILFRRFPYLQVCFAQSPLPLICSRFYSTTEFQLCICSNHARPRLPLCTDSYSLPCAISLHQMTFHRLILAIFLRMDSEVFSAISFFSVLSLFCFTCSFLSIGNMAEAVTLCLSKNRLAKQPSSTSSLLSASPGWLGSSCRPWQLLLLMRRSRRQQLPTRNMLLAEIKEIWLVAWSIL